MTEATHEGEDVDSLALTPTGGLGRPSPADPTHPRVFISYSWTSEQYKREVIELAVNLMRDGVEVVIDEWYLEPGQDKFAFMERCVTDGTIQKVLMLCDKAYADKADSRRGGVGDETSIITPEVYRRADQTKFVPVLMERGADGTEFLPAYLGSRLYIDLSDRAHRKQYKELLRSIYGVPRRPKPELGTPPAWLNNPNEEREGQSTKAETRHEVTETQSAEDTKRAITLVPKSFAEYSWAELKTIADMIAAARTDSEGLGIAGQYRLIAPDGKLRGETRPVVLSDNTKATIRIAGFRHDERVDGSGRKAGITFEFADVPVAHSMSLSHTNNGGWEGSEMRAYLNGGFSDLLPEAMRACIVKVGKRTNNRGFVGADDPLAVGYTEDRLWLLSMSEVYGELSHQSKNAPSHLAVYSAEGSQYKVYADHGVSVANYGLCAKAKDDEVSGWWLRSPGAGSSSSFHLVGSDGDWDFGYAGYSRGVSPGFCF